MNIPMIGVLVALILIVGFFLWKKVLHEVFNLTRQLLLFWLIIALMRLLSLPV